MERTEAGEQYATLPLQELRHRVDASRFLFSSLSSLHFEFGWCQSVIDGRPQGRSCLLSILQLLTADASCFSSLRRLGIDDTGWLDGEELELSFMPLARLTALTHCRVCLTGVSAPTCSSLLSALSSLPTLTSLDLGNFVETWPQLLQLLCTDIATPLLLRLKSLVLPSDCDYGTMHNLHDAFLCRLSSLPAPPALQHFSGVYEHHFATGLLSVFSLPQLTELNLQGSVWPSELIAFASSFNSAPAPLVSLVLPIMDPEPEDDGDAVAHGPEKAADLIGAVRLLLSRFTALRHLSCDAETAGGIVGLPHSQAGDGTTGCSASLYRLILRGSRILRLPFTAPLSFPLLTELEVTCSMTDAEVKLLLPACPQLLNLSCAVPIVLVAARCCDRVKHPSDSSSAMQPRQMLSPSSLPAPSFLSSSASYSLAPCRARSSSCRTSQFFSISPRSLTPSYGASG